MKVGFRYHAICRAPDGTVKWETDNTNIVPTSGLNKFLDATLKTGGTPAWYCGIVGATNVYNAADTLAAHAGWAEFTDYTGNRKALTFAAPAAGSTAATAVVFTVAGATGSENVNGFFICNAETGTTGTLLSEVDFTEGVQAVADDDTITVTPTCTAAST